jgi:hypothetical protein
MMIVKQLSSYTEWSETLADATHALAHLDADRLEEMALCCAALVREERAPFDIRRRDEPGFSGAGRGLASFARVLEATKANLDVMRRVGAVRARQLEYGMAHAAESEHGDD